MVSLVSLAVPILLSAVVVFVASSIIHMVLPFHRNDLRRLPKEDDVLDALRRLNIPPGDYAAPHAGSPAGMKSPEFLEKWKKGPIVLMTVAPGGPPTLAPSLIQWFLYSILVSVFAGYVAGRAVGPGTEYLQVFRFAGVTAFVGYSLALMQHSIWNKRSWATTLKSMADGLLYGLLTAGVFGWLWPR
ncbi:MAG TPA: hypothetical protein VLD67_09100 [Vicinamibacterales bacterium]|nr:hypothetical protein [Vicinamibacterales bacterium]